MAKVFRPEDDQMSRSSRCNKEQNNEHLRLRPQNQIKILKKILGLRIIQFDGQAQ